MGCRVLSYKSWEALLDTNLTGGHSVAVTTPPSPPAARSWRPRSAALYKKSDITGYWTSLF